MDNSYECEISDLYSIWIQNLIFSVHLSWVKFYPYEGKNKAVEQLSMSQP